MEKCYTSKDQGLENELSYISGYSQKFLTYSKKQQHTEAKVKNKQTNKPRSNVELDLCFPITFCSTLCLPALVS